MEAKNIISCTEGIILLTKIAYPHGHFIGCLFLHNNIDNAVYSLTAIKYRAATLDDFNALNILGRYHFQIIFASPRYRIAIEQYQGAIAVTTYA